MNEITWKEFKDKVDGELSKRQIPQSVVVGWIDCSFNSGGNDEVGVAYYKPEECLPDHNKTASKNGLITISF